MSSSEDRLPMPFVVGAGRSGTTLLRLMLDAHPALCVPAETGFLTAILIALRDEPPLTPTRFWEIVTGFHTWTDHSINPDEFREALQELEPFTVADGVRTFYRLSADQAGKPRFGDKTPHYVQHMGTIERMLPEAHFVHIIRDGRDVAVSLRSHPLWSDYDVESIAKSWARDVDLGRSVGLGRSNYLEVHYEQLLREPERVLRSICDLISLPYDDAMVHYEEHAARRMQAVQSQVLADGRLLTREERLAMHAAVSTPPDLTRIGRWRGVLTDEEERAFRGHAGHVLAAEGYDEPQPGALRVLLTNSSLAGRGGTQLYLRDLAIALQSRGHQPILHSPAGGTFADELRTLGIPVVQRLDASFPEPDVVHCQHHDEALAALSRFPNSPGVYVQHSAMDWQDHTPQHPRLLRYVAVDEACRQRVVEAGVLPERVTVIGNGVDLGRFQARSALPDRPRRALLFSNHVHRASEILPPLREACARAGLELDIRGSGMANPIETPEHTLGSYDVVFAFAQCALEALAVGCAVVVCGEEGLAGLVTAEVVAEWRARSFSRELITRPFEVDLVVEEIERYDTADARSCRDWVRSSCGLDSTVSAVLDQYAAVISQWRSGSAAADPAAELVAMAPRLAMLGPLRADVRGRIPDLEARLAYVTRERDGFRDYAANLRQGIDQYLSEHAIRALAEERDAAVEERDRAVAERDAALADRDAANARRDATRPADGDGSDGDGRHQ